MADPQKYRDEAARLRVEAGTVTSSEARRQMLDIADQYDRLAKSVETARIQPLTP